MHKKQNKPLMQSFLDRSMSHRYWLVLFLLLLIWVRLFIGSLFYGRVISFVSIEVFLLLPTFFFNVAICFVLYPLDDLSIELYDVGTLSSHFSSSNIGPISTFSALNKWFIFPSVVVLYIAYIIISKTGLGGLDTAPWFIRLEGSFFVFLLIVSGIMVQVSPIKNEKKYVIQKKSQIAAYIFLLLVSGLSILLTYLAHQRFLELGVFGLILGWFLGGFIFLLGVASSKEED